MQAVRSESVHVSRNRLVKNIIFLIGLAATNVPAVGQATDPLVQHFDADPGWDGFRNRLRPETMPVVRQDCRIVGNRSEDRADSRQETDTLSERSVRNAWIP